MRAFLAPVLFLLILVGCAGQSLTPRQQLYAAEVGFTKAVEQATVYRQAGRIDDAAWSRIKVAIQSGSDALDRARASIDLPQSSAVWAAALEQVNAILTQLAVEQSKVTK